MYIVDDDEAVRDSLSVLLESKGYAVRSFGSAPDFLAVALIEGAIAAHERFGERLHAYSLWAPEQARAAAAAADAAFAAGVTVGPLQGLPLSIKDLFAAAGYPCFAGSSRRLPADPWERERPLVLTLRRQLGVITGKTHMVEFAFGGTGHNSHWGAPYNPWDTVAHRAPGGSSSGAGVSLLEGSALLAFGSDTAGSVRIPACMTGTVGLKVTFGRWPADGVVPLSPTFDTPGLLARSVCDVAYGALFLGWCTNPAYPDMIEEVRFARDSILLATRQVSAPCAVFSLAVDTVPTPLRCLRGTTEPLMLS